jgi:hypothetical protein
MKTALAFMFFPGLLFVIGLVTGQIPIVRGNIDGNRDTNPKLYWRVMKVYLVLSTIGACAAIWIFHHPS